MAKKRMFSLQIVDTDAFLDMPLSSQALYFHLSMRADDDGFVNSPKKIMKTIGCQEDDLKILLTKRFILGFDNGIVVIKHWRINNILRGDRYSETVYINEKKSLIIKENGSYTENIKQLATNGIPNGNHLAPQYSIDKDSIDKDSIILQSDDCVKFDFQEKLKLMENNDKDARMKIIALFWRYKGFKFENDTNYQNAIKRELRGSQRLTGYNLKRIEEVMYWLNGQDWCDWGIETVHKYIDKNLNEIKNK